MDKNNWIVLDCFGNDNGPEIMILGAIKAMKECDNLSFTFVGPSQLIKSLLIENNIKEDRYYIIDTDEYISNTDNPFNAIMEKNNSSLVLAMKEVNNQEKNYDGLITAGSSGAIIMGSFRFLSLPSKIRPCLAAIIPNEKGGDTILLDTGANIDCTCGQLHQFALLGSDMVKKLYRIESPRVALLSNGSESTKGNKLVKETYQILEKETLINFVGNAEANYIFNGDYDVVVTDGFAGNQVLKSIEGMAKRLIKDIVKYSKNTNNPSYMEVVNHLMELYDFSSLGGAFVLGTCKPVIKAHGYCNEKAIISISKMIINYSNGNSFFEN